MSYRGKYYDDREREPRGNVAGMIGWGLIGVLCMIVLSAIGYLALTDIRAEYTTDSAPAVVATQAPAIAVPTQRAYVQRAPVIVQSVPAGEAPQPVTIPAPQPIAPPVVDSSGTAVEQPQPQPIIIVHQTSADGAHQVITGSGACKVSRVAARCGK